MAGFNLPNGGRIDLFDAEMMVNVLNAGEDVMKDIVFTYESKIKVLMTTSPRGGRVYRVGSRPNRGLRGGRRGGGALHKASAPGEPPAVDTGLLRASIQSFTRTIGDAVIGVVSSPLIYARFLEIGTVKMDPRPVWNEALVELESEIRKIVEGKG